MAPTIADRLASVMAKVGVVAELHGSIGVLLDQAERELGIARGGHVSASVRLACSSLRAARGFGTGFLGRGRFLSAAPRKSGTDFLNVTVS